MVTLCQRVTGFPKEQVVGQSGILDSSRYRTFIAQELDRSVESVTAMVLGGHGDDMVPVRSTCQVGGVPVDRLIPSERLDEIEQRVRMAGGEIVSLLKTGSAFYAPASAAIRMAEAYLQDKKEVLPCAALLEGEYGVQGYYFCVPVLIGAGGGGEGHRDRSGSRGEERVRRVPVPCPGDRGRHGPGVGGSLVASDQLE